MLRQPLWVAVAILLALTVALGFLLVKLVRRLEERFGEDLDGDGQVGHVSL